MSPTSWPISANWAAELADRRVALDGKRRRLSGCDIALSGRSFPLSRCANLGRHAGDAAPQGRRSSSPRLRPGCGPGSCLGRWVSSNTDRRRAQRQGLGAIHVRQQRSRLVRAEQRKRLRDVAHGLRQKLIFLGAGQRHRTGRARRGRLVSSGRPLCRLDRRRLCAASTAQITPRIDGTLTSVPVRDTDHVHHGQVLATIDPADAQLAVQQARPICCSPASM